MMGEATRTQKCYEAQSELRSGVWRGVTNLDPLVMHGDRHQAPPILFPHPPL